MAKQKFEVGKIIEHEGKKYRLDNAIDIDKRKKLTKGDEFLFDNGLTDNLWMLGKINFSMNGTMIDLPTGQSWVIFPYRKLGELLKK